MKRLALLLVGSLFAHQAWATNYLPIDPAACLSLNAGSYSCEKEQYDHRLTARGTDDVRTCQQDQTRGFVCKFQWPHDAPAQVIPLIHWNVGYGGSTTGSVCWRTSIGCKADGGEYVEWEYGATTFVSDATLGSPTWMNLATLPSTTPFAGAADRVCKLKVERVIGEGGCVDNLLDNARVLWIQLTH